MTSESLRTRSTTTRVRRTTCGALLLLAGVWEVGASLVVLGTTYFDVHLTWRRIALVSLVVFTVLATLMFKVYPKVKYYGLLSNVSVAGGLALAAML